MTDLTRIILNHVEGLRVSLKTEFNESGQQRKYEKCPRQQNQKHGCERSIHGETRNRSVLFHWNFAPVIGAKICETQARETVTMLTVNPRTRNGSRQIRWRLYSSRAAAAISKNAAKFPIAP